MCSFPRNSLRPARRVCERSRRRRISAIRSSRSAEFHSSLHKKKNRYNKVQNSRHNIQLNDLIEKGVLRWIYKSAVLVCLSLCWLPIFLSDILWNALQKCYSLECSAEVSFFVMPCRSVILWNALQKCHSPECPAEVSFWWMPCRSVILMNAPPKCHSAECPAEVSFWWMPRRSVILMNALQKCHFSQCNGA